MTIYTINTDDQESTIKFVFDEQKELILAHPNQDLLETITKRIQKLTAGGIKALRPGPLNDKLVLEQTTILAPIPKSDAFYEQAVIEHLEREGFSISKESMTSETLDALINTLSQLAITPEEKKQAITLAIFADEDERKQLLKDLN